MWGWIAIGLFAIGFIGQLTDSGEDGDTQPTLTTEAREMVETTVETTTTFVPPPTSVVTTVAAPTTEPPLTTEAPPESPPVTVPSAPTSPPSTDATELGNPIPGLMPVDVYLNLEDRGWVCDGPTPGLYTQWFCTLPGTDATVEIASTTVTDVLFVEATAASPEEWQWLAFIATVPYEGSTPDEARSWVENNLSEVQFGAGAEQSFGGVDYLLGSVGGDNRFLTINPNP